MARNQGSKWKTAVNWVTQNIRRMVLKRALERWETKLANCEVTPQAIWPIVKSLIKRGGSETPSAIHGPLGPTCYSDDKVNVIQTAYRTSSPSMTRVTLTTGNR
jgi:hypothetical protein